jgi:hypothetical protein
MTAKIANKADMYAALARGDFGNTIPQYFSVADWCATNPRGMWGIRTLRPGGPCYMYVPTDRVLELARDLIARGHEINISQMIDATCRVTLWADVQDSDAGLVVYGVEYPPVGASWRATMPTYGKHWRGLAGLMVLRRHLNPSSLADLDVLRERYPGAVVELSACDRSIGRVPGRNAVVWEVRHY